MTKDIEDQVMKIIINLSFYSIIFHELKEISNVTIFYFDSTDKNDRKNYFTC